MLTLKDQSKKTRKKLEKTVPEREHINVSHAARKNAKGNLKTDKKKNGRAVTSGKVSKVKSKKQFNKKMKTDGKMLAVKKLVNGK